MTTPEPGRKQPHPVAFALLGLVISVSLLAWALRGVSFDDVATQLRDARPLPLILAAVLATSSFLFRAIRWRLLLRDLEGQEVSFAARWHATAIGFMANNLLPLRIGEVVRAWTVSRLGNVRFLPALTSVVVERVLDLFSLILCLSFGLLLSGLPASTRIGDTPLSRAAVIVGAAGLIALGIGIWLLTRPASAERVLRGMTPKGKLQEKMVGLLHGVVDGLKPLQRGHHLGQVALWSIAMWGTSALSFYIAFPAFGIDVGVGGALLVIASVAFGVAVPSTPGFFGPLEAVVVGVLALYGVPRDVAFSYAIAYHVVTFVPITVLGLISLARTPIAFRDLRRRDGV